MTIDIREIAYDSDDYQTLLKLRYDVLRKPRGITFADEDIAADEEKIHIAAFTEGLPIGCVLLKPMDSQNVWLHQMAVSNTYQGQGIGASLVRHAEMLAAKHGFKNIQMHANEFAQKFYEKLGYQTEGNLFDEHAVQSIKMFKIL